MYCPMCLNDTLSLSSRGTVHVEINEKKMDSRKFIYNKEKEPHPEILKNLYRKMEDFFKWYSSFQNQEPIREVQIYSYDFQCTSGCRINMSNKTSVIDVLFSLDEVQKILNDLGKKYELKISWDHGQVNE